MDSGILVLWPRLREGGPLEPLLMVAELGTRALHSLPRALSPPFRFTNSGLHNCMKSQNVSVSWKLRDCITQMGRLKPRNREVVAQFPTTVKWEPGILA